MQLNQECRNKLLNQLTELLYFTEQRLVEVRMKSHGMFSCLPIEFQEKDSTDFYEKAKEALETAIA